MSRVFAWLKKNRFPLLLSSGLVVFFGVLWSVLWADAGQGRVWLGITIFNIKDAAYYFSLIDQVRQGAWFMHNPYAPLPQAPFWHPMYLLIGLSSRIARMDVMHAYLLTTAIVLCISIFILHAVSRRMTANERDASWATAIIALCGGFGFFILMLSDFGRTPSNLFAPEPDINSEAFLFPSWFNGPHVVLSICLLPYALISIWDAINDRTDGRARWKGWLAAFFLALIHPYALLTIGLYLLSVFVYRWIVSRKPPILRLLPFVLSMLVGVIPHIWGMLTNSGQQRLLLQNSLPLSPLWIWFVTFLPWLAIAAWRLIKWRVKPEERWIVFWLIASIVAILLPFQWDRKLTEGWHAALVWLSLPIIFAFREKWLRTKFAAVILLLFFSLSSIQCIVFALPMKGKTVENQTATQQTMQAWTWMRENTPKDARVLTENSSLGLWTAPYAGRAVWSGHDDETPDFNRKNMQASAFFSTMPKSDAIGWLDENHLNVIMTTDATHKDRLDTLFKDTDWHAAATFGDTTVFAR